MLPHSKAQADAAMDPIDIPMVKAHNPYVIGMVKEIAAFGAPYESLCTTLLHIERHAIEQAWNKIKDTWQRLMSW